MKRQIILAIAVMLMSSGGFAQSKMDAYSLSVYSTLKSAETKKPKIMALSDDGTTEMVGAFITVGDSNAYAKLKKHGVQLGYGSGNITTAYIPLSAIDAVLAMDDVIRLRFAQQMTTFTANTRSVCYVDDIHQGIGLDHPYKGSGVIYGTVDCGIDFQHAAFKDENGKSRIRMAYLPDATRKERYAKTNYPVTVGDYSTTLTQGYVYDKDGIAGLTTGNKEDIHGTHTVGIAVGGRYGSDKYYGMAPEAELVLVDATDLSDVNITNGVAFVFSEAQKAGKPAVVNLSIGSMTGCHSSTDEVVSLLQSLTGPGRIICSATGNSGDIDMWLNKPEGAIVATLLTNPFEMIGATVLDGDVDVWGKDDKPFTLRLYARSDDGQLNLLYDSDKSAEEEKVTNLRYLTVTSNFKVTHVNMEGNNRVYLEMKGVQLRDGYELVMEISGDSEVDAWSNTRNMKFAGKEGTDYVYGSSDGSYNRLCCFDSAISVGSYNVASTYIWAGSGEEYGYSFPFGEVSYFSSYGVDRDGRQHPMVLAPGAIVTSSVNYYSENGKLTESPNNAIVQYDKKDGRPQPYAINMGTSMASPVVAGIVALWLEHNPLLTPQEVKNIIALTSVHDEHTVGENAKRSGFGKINALEGMLTVPTEVVSMVSGSEPVIVATAGGFSVLVPDTDKQSAVEVYNAAGQCVLRGSVSGNVTQSFSIDHSGIYVVKVGKTAKKIVI